MAAASEEFTRTVQEQVVGMLVVGVTAPTSGGIRLQLGESGEWVEFYARSWQGEPVLSLRYPTQTIIEKHEGAGA